MVFRLPMYGPAEDNALVCSSPRMVLHRGMYAFTLGVDAVRLSGYDPARVMAAPALWVYMLCNWSDRYPPPVAALVRPGCNGNAANDGTLIAQRGGAYA